MEGPTSRTRTKQKAQLSITCWYTKTKKWWGYRIHECKCSVLFPLDLYIRIYVLKFMAFFFYSHTYAVISDSWTWPASQGKFNHISGADWNFLEETEEVLELVCFQLFLVIDYLVLVMMHLLGVSQVWSCSWIGRYNYWRISIQTSKRGWSTSCWRQIFG